MEEMIPNTCSSSIITTPTQNNNNNNNNSKPSSTSLERKVRPQKDQAVNCPRCNSTNTKFCYYNNYSLTQPRYFCKTCRRYWTEGGSLRNIPVGGGSRKNKRSSSSSPSSLSSPASKKISSHDLVASIGLHQHQEHQHQQQQHHLFAQNPKIHHPHLHHQGQDLNLGYPPTQQEFRSLSEFMQLPSIETTPKSQMIPNPTGSNNPSSNDDENNNNGAANHHMSALELLNGLTSSRGLTPFMPMPLSVDHGGVGGGGVYSSGFPLQDYKPSLNFSLVDVGNGYGSLQGEMHHHHQQQQQEQQEQEQGADHHHHQQQQQQQQQQASNGRLLFPFEDLKQVSSTNSGDHNNNNNNNSDDNNHQEQNGEQEDDTPPGYWSGMLGNGGSW
ncbi:hypothetical protein SOVF_148620 [Spinacia oleracea]|nr:hypothetical protein SOVF_148620 [Spinacia oleracea]